MTATEVFNAYLTFLWQQFQYDWGWLSNPWLLVIGHIIYLFFFTIKWMVLLAPITIPITLLKWPVNRRPSISREDQDKFFNN